MNFETPGITICLYCFVFAFFVFPFSLYLGGSKRFLVCIAVSLSLLKGCELLWNPAGVGPDSTVLKLCQSTVFIVPTVRWAVFLWIFLFWKLSVSCT